MEKSFKKRDSVRLIKNIKINKMYDGIEMLEWMLFDGYNEIDEVTDTGVAVLLKDNQFYYHFNMLTK